jgi:hypothetical protein
MAAVLVLLAAGANARAYTVWCVPNTSVNPGCTAVPSPDTIQGAVNSAASFDIIFVGPGTYHESVRITSPGGIRDGISLFGAQAGHDARVDRHDPSKESIVDATLKAGPAFLVTANYVVIDGFTVQGGTVGSTVGSPGAGIYIARSGTTTPCAEQDENLCGPQVLNSILQDNSGGVYLSDVEGAAIERNLFTNNNAENAEVYGFGIVAGFSEGVVITENEFTENKAAAMAVGFTEGATLTKNTSENDGAFVIFEYTTGCQFSHNQGKNFGHEGVIAFGTHVYPDAAVDIGPDNSSLEISYNELENGTAPISNGIAFTNIYGGGSNHLLNVVHNKIKQFPDYGIVAKVHAGTGMLYNSSIIDNGVYDNGRDGILIEAAEHDNFGIDLFDNNASGNANFDCKDETTYGTGTPLPTGNTWFNNNGILNSPAGLCTPVTLHEHH